MQVVFADNSRAFPNQKSVKKVEIQEQLRLQIAQIDGHILMKV